MFDNASTVVQGSSSNELIMSLVCKTSSRRWAVTIAPMMKASATHWNLLPLRKRESGACCDEGTAVGAGRALLRGMPQGQQRSKARGGGAGRLRVPPCLCCLRARLIWVNKQRKQTFYRWHQVCARVPDVMCAYDLSNGIVPRKSRLRCRAMRVACPAYNKQAIPHVLTSFEQLC